jgi:hypothetical protein
MGVSVTEISHRYPPLCRTRLYVAIRSVRLWARGYVYECPPGAVAQDIFALDAVVLLHNKSGR